MLMQLFRRGRCADGGPYQLFGDRDHGHTVINQRGDLAQRIIDGGAGILSGEIRSCLGQQHAEFMTERHAQIGIETDRTADINAGAVRPPSRSRREVSANGPACPLFGNAASARRQLSRVLPNVRRSRG